MTSKFVSLILLLPLLAVIGPLGCKSSRVNDMMHSTSQSARQILSTSTSPRGIRAALIHRDQFYNLPENYCSSTEKLHEDARRSVNRAEFLSRGRVLARQLLDAPSPAGQTDEWETPLSDGADAEYLMEISLGTPPQKFVAVADTGSDLVWLQCLPCQECFKQDRSPFDPSLSSTYAQLSCSSSICKFLNESGSVCVPDTDENLWNSSDCQYQYSYGDGSQTTGALSQETITLDSLEGNVQAVPNFGFGCSYNSTSVVGSFDKSDGLVGLGQGSASFPSQLGHYYGNKFSYCLVSRSSNSSVVEKSPLIFGDAAVHGSLPLQFTPLIPNPKPAILQDLFPELYSTFYYVGLEGIMVNGASVTIPASAFAINETDGSGGTILDSGTTMTALTQEAFEPLVAAISDAIVDYRRVNSSSPEFELCYAASWDEWASEYGKRVPALTFQMANSSSFHLLVAGSWTHYNDTVVCLAMTNAGSSSSVFGNVQQAGHLILYDLENQQIGFAPANCREL